MFFRAILLFLAGGSAASAQSLNLEALRAVQEFAAEFCGELMTEGSSQNVKVDGSAEAKLSGLLDKLADIGVQGTAEFDQQKYVGLVREELGDDLKNNRECRTRVWDDLKVAVISKPDAAAAAQAAKDFKFPFTASKWLTEADLSGYSAADLRLMRNEIYARYGYMFQSSDLKQYFAGQPWYVPLYPDAETAYSKMSPAERANVLTIKAVEAARS